MTPSNDSALALVPASGDAAGAAALTAHERQAKGVRALAALLNYWLARSSWSHNTMSALSDWAYGEPSPMQGATISRCRNGNQARGAGLAHLDVLAQLNRAIWTWHERGASKAIAEFGLLGTFGIQQQWLDDAVWLPRADRPREPLDLGDMAALLAGRLELPYLPEWHFSRSTAGRLCAAVQPLLDSIARERGWGPGEATKRFSDAYPSTDRKRQFRLRELLSGQKPLAASELDQELPFLAEMVRRVCQLDPTDYGPAELLAELSSESHPPS